MGLDYHPGVRGHLLTKFPVETGNLSYYQSSFYSSARANVHFVLTLPGIAGIILTIGLSVDANVLIYERLREEMAVWKIAQGRNRTPLTRKRSVHLSTQTSRR